MRQRFQDSYDSARLPRGYLERGYLDAKGNIHPELITDHAEAVARELGNMAPSQFRRYFNHARSIEARMRQGASFEDLRAELDKMRPLVMAALADRNAKVTPIFAEMLQRMVQAVQSSEDFLKGFLPHFESVLAYFTYYSSNSRRGGNRR